MSFLAQFYNVGIVLFGVSLLGASAGAIGCFAVLRRRALTGDALAHAALPGVCVAFLIVGERSLPALLLGALGSGVAGIAIIGAFRRWTRVKEDAAIGSVLSVFFGVGVVLLSVIQRLEGGSRAGLESFIFGKTAGMIWQDVELISALSLVTLAAIVLCFKEFELVAFDPGFTHVQGFPVFLLDFMLMLLIVLAVVIGLPAVGVLMIAALLIVPPAAARFWTDRLGVLLLLAAFFGALAGATGTLVSASIDKFPAGPAIILAATLIFVGSLVAAPRLVDFMLMLLIVCALVIGLPVLGALIVAALLSTAAARYWVGRLDAILLLDVFFAALSVAVGTIISATINELSRSPAIILAATSIFVVSLVVAPRRGLVARWRHRARLEEPRWEEVA